MITIKRASYSYFLDKRIDPKITELVNQGEFRSKSHVVEMALREFFERRDEPVASGNSHEKVAS